VTVAVLALAAAGCGKSSSDSSGGSSESGKYSGKGIGLAYDIGGKGDQSFNDAAFAGFQKAEKEFKIGGRDVEPSDNESTADKVERLEQLAKAGYNPIIGVGFVYAPAVKEVAAKYPKVTFGIIDDSTVQAKNVADLVFHEEQASYLAGVAAAKATKKNHIGFIGGVDIPLIHKFEAGYRAGVKQVCPDCTVIAQYAGVTPEAFRNPGRGKELALAQYQSGVNIIFHASGSTGLGVFEAARQTGKMAIGVDADQYQEAPGFILTSMVKGVDAAVYDAIKRVKDGKFTGGIYQFGLAENGVGYVYDEHNRKLIPDSVRTRLEGLREQIIAGKITVPDTR
jgi:basic membrane protein A